MELKLNNFKTSVKKLSPLGKITGLMFKAKNTQNLLFEFKKNTTMPIHSFFVFFRFLAVWLDENNKIIEYKIVKPFTLHAKSKKPFRKLIEIPLNVKNIKLINSIVGKHNL